ncbi:hypothetical protein [Phaeobacter sp. J2-8]|uniref:hypothetical protein n=1 Tax=Phaeobacter sp. J2-8 TaxID=2931394 RepID=UPI001FD37E1A|nr:hypothetical protein [Phaeobacter sp. J2-8]MCJ7872126.1 hypothetical protein [Phaeobacter sp. J2-8]
MAETGGDTGGETGQGAKSSSNAARAARILVTLGEAAPRAFRSLSWPKLWPHRARLCTAPCLLWRKRGWSCNGAWRGKYHIGPAIHAIAARQQPITTLVETLRPSLMQIAADTGLATFLMARAGFDSVCLDFQTGFATVSAMFDGVGGRLPLGVGVGGQVILCGMDPASRDRILEINAPRFAEWGMRPEDIRAEIATYAGNGWIVVSRNSGLGGETKVSSLAVPLRSVGLPELAVSVLAPGEKIAPDLRARVLEACARHLPK